MEVWMWIVLLLAVAAVGCWVMFFRKAPAGAEIEAAAPPAETPQPDAAAGVTPEDLATSVEAEPDQTAEPEAEPQIQTAKPAPAPAPEPDPKPKRVPKAKPKPKPEAEPELPFETSPTAEAAEAPAEPETPASEPVAAPSAAQPAAPESAPETAPGQPKLYDAPSDGPRDNLSALNGVGPALQSRLNRLGIYYFHQIAAWTEDEAAWVDEEIRGQGRILREDWSGQARNLLEEEA